MDDERDGRLGDAVEASALTTLWRERGVLETFGAADGSQSLAASDRALTSGLARSGGGVKLDDATRASLATEVLKIGDVLGRGGMGFVTSAVQESLRREVAVKRLEDHADETALASLLKEAWVGGLLTHPNVAPVHTLVDLDGSPAIVMKRITGVSWRDAIRDPSRIPEADRREPLAFHLRVLVAVCNAVHHAHQRGVLHLDLKPDNVMLGRFGETCVVDWGLAAGWGPSAPTWMPRAGETRSVSGTPDYMAPEIAAAAGADLSPRTDVYLLGATLHEVVTGKAPHRGGPALDRMMRAYQSEPQTYGPDVPEELVRVLHRAMQRDPARRFESAEALRDAIEHFLRHRHDEERLAEARERIAKLESLALAGAPEIDVARAFGGARFALREAEAARPDAVLLPALKQRLHAAMARAALDAGNLERAEQHLAELFDASPDLHARLRQARERDAARSQQLRALESLASRHDLDQGSRFRRGVLVFFAGVLLAGHLGYGVLDRAGLLSHDYLVLALLGLGSWVPVTAFVAWRRRALFRNHANAVLFGIAYLAFGAQQALLLSLWGLEVPFERGIVAAGVVYLLASGGVTMLVSGRFFPSVVFAGAGMIAAALLPMHVWDVLGIGASASLATVGLAWPPERAAAS